jgi:Domain of unknown function (DUF955).
MEHLLDIADGLGVTVEFTDLSHLGRNGDCHARTGRVRLHNHLPRRATRSVLAHELAHYVFGDVPSKFGPVNAKQERRADEWAALQLITPDAYRDAEMLRGGHIPSMAHDLGVISRTVEAYQRVLARIGDTVYVDGRMGVGQFQHKVKIA